MNRIAPAAITAALCRPRTAKARAAKPAARAPLTATAGARRVAGGRAAAASARRQRGVTLVESLTCMTVLAVTLGAVLPGFGSALERRRVEAAAAQLETDVQFTRSLAVAHNRTLRLEIARNEHGSCYIVHAGDAGDCACAPQGAVCAAGVVPQRVVHFPADAGVAISASVGSMVFEPMRGTVTPTGTLRVQGTQVAVHQIVNLMGRVRSCSPGGAVPGVARC